MLDTKISSTFTELNVRPDHAKPHFVRLHDSVVKNLERSLAAGGEQCGILLGSVETGANCTIAVESFEPATKVEDRVRTWTPKVGSKQKVVGVFRSYSRPEFVLDPADRSLFQRCFPKDGRLLLLVRPPKGEAGTAMFFLGENGQFAADRATVEFPFNLRELGAEEAPAPVSAPVPAALKPASAPVPAPVPVALKPAATPVPAPVAVAPKPAAAPIPAPVAVAPKPAAAPVPAPAAVAPKPAAAPVPAPAAITPKPSPASLAPKPAPAAIAKPARGGLAWKLAIAGVAVVASVVGLGGLRVFDGQNAQPQPPAQPVAQEPAPVERVAIVDSAAAEPKKPESAKAPKPRPETVVAPSPKTPASASTASNVAPPASTPPAAPSRPAEVQVADNSIAKPPAPVQSQPAATQTNTPPPPVQAPQPRTVTPVTPPPTSAPANPVPTARPAVASVPVTPPRAIRSSAPVVQDSVRRSITGEVVIKVRATVDATGRVISAESNAKGDPTIDVLAGSAIAAVKRWQFEPARRGDEKVSGDVELSFTFRK